MTDDAPALTRTQRARAEALNVARRALGKPTMAGPDATAVGTTELVDVAVYITTGVHPFDRYVDGDDQ